MDGKEVGMEVTGKKSRKTLVNAATRECFKEYLFAEARRMGSVKRELLDIAFSLGIILKEEE